MTTLTTKFEGWDLDTSASDEPRVRDLDIAVRAGLARPRNIRKVIDRNLASLGEFGTIRVCSVTEQTGRGGRPGREYWLNEGQATWLVSRLETPQGLALSIAIVKLFVAFRRGQLAPPAPAAAPADAPPVDFAHVVQARISDDPRGAARLRGWMKMAATLTRRTVHSIQGELRQPYGAASVYRIPLNVLEKTIADVQRLIEASEQRKQLPAERRQLGLFDGGGA